MADQVSAARRPSPRRAAAVLVALTLLVAGCSASGDGTQTPTTDGVGVALDPPPPFRVPVVPVESRPLGPPASSPVALVRRDCGQSVPLPDGGAVWFYCDSTMFEVVEGAPEGSEAQLRWFVNSSAALATDDEPLVMIDDLDAHDRVQPVLTPRPDYPVCADGEGRFTWPSAAVPVADDESPAGREVIAVYYGNVCVVPGNYVGGELGLAVLRPPEGPPDPASPASLEATILDDRVFGREPLGAPFGQAGVRWGDHVYVYRCPPADEACQVARAPARTAAVADADRYEVWDGTGWSPYGHQGEAAVAMAMPRPVRGLKPSVEWVSSLEVFVWADHLHVDPGTVALRVARQPWGPWTDAVEVDLPGCVSFYPLICFAVEVHEQLSSPSTIGLTWYDPTFAAGEAVPSRSAAVEVEIGR